MAEVRNDSLADSYGESVSVRVAQDSPTMRLENERKLKLQYEKRQVEPPALIEPVGRGGSVEPAPAGGAPTKREPGFYAAPEGEPGGAGQPVLPSETRILPSAGEMVKQPIGGVLDAVKGLLRMPQEIAAGLKRFNDEMLQALAETKGGVPPEIQAALDKARAEPDADTRTAAILAKVAGKLPDVAPAESIGGSLVRALSEFLGPFMAARKVVRGVPAIESLLSSSGTVKRLAGEAVAGNIAGVPASLVVDPQSPRFSNMVNALAPGLKNPVTEFLAAPEGNEIALEDRFRERMKNAAEGLVLGGALDVLVSSVIAGRAALRAQSVGRKFKRATVAATAAQREAEPGTVTLFRHGVPEEGKPAFFGPSEGEVAPFAQAGPLRSLELPVAEAEKFRASNLLGAADTPADLRAAAALAGRPEAEFVLPAPLSRFAREHYLTIEQRLDAASNVVKELHDASGGASFNLKHGDLGGTDAYAVAFAPDLSEVLPGAPTQQQIRAFLDKVRQAGIDLDNEKVSIGTWFDKDTGKTYLDVVATPRDLETAISWGKQFNQKAIFDLKNFKEIETGGTGLALDDLPPLTDRLRVIAGVNGVRNFPDSVREVTEMNAEAARQGLWRTLARWMRDETGGITLGPKDGPGLTRAELNQLGMIGAGAMMNGRTASDTFREAIEAVVRGMGKRLTLEAADWDRVYAEAQKIVERNIKSSMFEAEKLAREQGAERTYQGLPATGELLDMFHEGKFRMDWYDQASAELRRWFGKDADRMADLIAATSLGTRASDEAGRSPNVQEAIAAYIALKSGKSVDEAGITFAGPTGPMKKLMVERVFKGLSPESPKAGNFARNIKGDPNAVTIDRWMARIFYGRERVSPEQSNFLQHWVRQMAWDAGVQPREMQAGIWVAKIMREEFAFPDDQRFLPLRDLIRNETERAVNEGRLALPGSDLSEAGFIRWGTMWFLSRVAAGALYGASGQHDTMEDRVANALVWAGATGAMSPKALAALTRTMAKVLLDEKPKITRRPPGRSSAALGIANEPIKPEASTFTSLAQEYAERVRIATRGEILDEETGFIKVRPKESTFADAAELRRTTMTPQAVQDLMPTIKMSDSEAVAMAEVMNEQGLKLRAMAQFTKEGGFREQDVRAFLQQLYVFGRMDPNRLGALAEAGRTLGALNDPVSGMNQFLDQFTEVFKNAKATVTPQRVIEAIAGFKTPEELAAFARQLTKPGFKDYFFEVWINGLLSGPKTWVVNGLSNSATLLYTIGERGLAGQISHGAEGGVAPGEAVAMLKGIVEAHSDALRVFWRTLKNDTDATAATKIEGPQQVITAANLDLTGAPGRAVDMLGSAIRFPGRVVRATDEYFKGIATRAELRAQATRSAFHEVERLGLEGREAIEKMNQVIHEFLVDPPASAMQKARQYSEYVTFTSALGETGQAIQQLQQTALGRAIVPFVKTPVNIFKMAGERMGPLGLASSRLRQELFSADQATRDIAKAKIALSSMTLAVIGYLGANGYITGTGPTDPVLAKQLRDTGWQPLSFWFDLNGDGQYDQGELVSYARGLEPLSMMFGMTVDAVNIMGHLGQAESEDLATMLVVAFSKNFTSKTFVKGVAQTVSTLANPEQAGTKQVHQFMTSLLPFSSALRQAAMALDPEVRDAQTLLEAYKKMIPGASKDVPADTDLFGNHRYLGGGLGSQIVPSAFVPAVNFVSPIFVNSASKRHQDVLRTLRDNDVRAPEAPTSIDGIKLSGREQYDLKRIAGGHTVKIEGRDVTLERGGQTMPEALRTLFGTPAWKIAKPGRGAGRDALAGLVIRGFYVDAARLVQQMPEHKDLRNAVLNARIQRAANMGVSEAELDAVRNQIGLE